MVKEKELYICDICKSKTTPKTGYRIEFENYVAYVCGDCGQEIGEQYADANELMTMEQALENYEPQRNEGASE